MMENGKFKITDDRRCKYIIGNMVIPVTDKIKELLNNDYSERNILELIYMRPQAMQFLDGSLVAIDSEGLDRWNELTHPKSIPESDIKHLGDELHEIRHVLANIGAQQNDMFNRFYAVLRNSAPQPKPTLFQRIFKRKKL